MVGTISKTLDKVIELRVKMKLLVLNKRRKTVSETIGKDERMDVAQVIL